VAQRFRISSAFRESPIGFGTSLNHFDADIIVIGAGPAGSAAAIAAARAGTSVMLLDRQAFPRDKPCGDLIGARAMRLARGLGIDERDLERWNRLNGVLVTADSGHLPLRPHTVVGRMALSRTDARIVPRTIFDDAMRRTALRAGATFQQAHVRTVSPWDGEGRSINAQIDGKLVTFRAPVTIVAGGYGCRVTGDLMALPAARETERPRGIAMRGYFSNVTAPAREIVFSLDSWVLPGYGWLFPLPDGRANVGIGTLVHPDESRSEHLHTLYQRYVNDPASPIASWMHAATPDAPPRTWPLDLGPRARRVAADGLLVAGESAALVGPMTGAGIAFALESGQQAGRTAAAAVKGDDPSQASLDEYATWVQRHPLAWLRAESRAHWLVSDHARLARTIALTRPLPFTPTLGARFLLHLG